MSVSLPPPMPKAGRLRSGSRAAHEARGWVGAVDVGATKTLVSVVPLPLAEWDRGVVIRRFATPTDPVQLVAMIAAALQELAGTHTVVAVGIGTPGPLDARRGVIVHSPNQRWHDIPLADLVGERVGVPVRLDDDANTGALGEWRLGAGRDRDPMAYVTLSTGIGCGLVVAGQLVRGAHGAAGEIGHLSVDPTGPPCSCGERGHVEAYAGGAGLVARAAAAWYSGRHDDDRPAPASAALVIRAARDGEPVARRLVDDAVEALAIGLAAVAVSVDPERIVIGGSLGLGQMRLVRRAAHLAAVRVIPEGRPALQVVPAGLGPQSVLAGAAVIAGEAAS